MNDNSTTEQKYKRWVNALNVTWEKGWMHAYGWVFYSPGGSKHDLSAADLTQLDFIEENGLFEV